MTTAMKERTTAVYSEKSEWLYRLLADIRRETASQPSPQAVSRIRARLLATIKTPAKVAA